MPLRPLLRYQPPLRCCVRPSSLSISNNRIPFRRPFHASPRYRSSSSSSHGGGGMPDHYATLDLPSDASPADIKKQFYALSKTHHPDRNPNDPKASERFVKVSEAYAILGSAEKRSSYDRDFLRASPRSYPTGSYSSHSSSSGPAGSRPPTGLSRRRTQFKGPPPSFYRSGGWGAQGEKRSESANRTSHYRGEQQQQQTTEQTHQQQAPGTGPAGFNQGFDNDVPHFDRDGHFRSHDAIERSKARTRRKRGMVDPADALREGGPSMLVNFVLMSGILTFIFGVSGALFGAPSNTIKQKHVAGS